MTTRAKTWGEFKRWCKKRKLNALPAHPWTIASYLRWVDRRHGAQSIKAFLDIIAREHLLKSARVPTRHPTVQKTLELIERRAQTSELRSNLFDDDVRLPSDEVQAKTPKAKAKEPDKASGDPVSRQRRTLRMTPILKSRRPT